MQNFRFYFRDNQNIVLRRFAHLLAIGLILISNFGISISRSSRLEDNSSTETINRPISDAAQQIFPLESYIRPTFSRPEPKPAMRPEQEKSVANGNTSLRSNPILLAPSEKSANESINSNNSYIKISPTQTQNPSISGGIKFVPTPTVQTPRGNIVEDKSENSSNSQGIERQQSQAMSSSQQTLIASGANAQNHPIVAYNKTQNEYLVVWTDSSGIPPVSLRGRRLSYDGTPISQEFLIANLGTQTVYTPKLIYASASNSYLLTWAESAGTTRTDRYRSYRCNPNGCPGWVEWDVTLPVFNLYVTPLSGLDGQPVTTPVLVTNSLTIWSVLNYAFDLAYNPDDNEFMLAWTQPPGGVNSNSLFLQYHLEAQRIGVNGQPLGVSKTLVPQVLSDIRLGYSTKSHKYAVVYDIYWLSGNLRDGTTYGGQAKSL